MSKIPSVLLKIKAEKEKEVEFLRNTGKLVEYKRTIDNLPLTKEFYNAITQPRAYSSPNLIAEFKITSPSNVRKGKPDFRPNANPEEIARIYQDCDVCAMSVLTDKNFKGTLEHLVRVRDTVDLPLLRKDFIIDPIQIYEARAYGADAILLISAILEPGQMRDYIGIAKDLYMECLVESHDEFELKKAIEAEARIFGINNRNLHTFEERIETTTDLLPLIPEDGEKAVVAESAVLSYKDVKKLSDPRINAMLIGTAFMRAEENIRNEIYAIQGR